uniref:F-box domain-containing protein n=1 Tax=Rhizophagus irregularis (strain DAOM 181602 / DAOM 197198 / MUCL 43194) TaxID=747089 RepID=U9UP86_RHIID
MAHQLPTDCLNEIIEYLEVDKLTLHSCVLVNRLWCEISVRILWRDIWNFKCSIFRQYRPLNVASSILSTLIACLPNESKELLYKNEIFISTPTSKPLMFNYAAFCKVLSINEINRIVDSVLRDEPSNTINSLSLKDRNFLVANEVIKMFTNQISSLKKLAYHYNQYHNNFSFNYFSGMRNLSELHCSSNLPSNFFYQLSHICHNLQSIFIKFHNDVVSNELKELISLQNNLKQLTLLAYFNGSWTNIIPTLTKHANTITKLYLDSDNYKDNSSLSFISLFSNLQEIIFSFSFFSGTDFEDFKQLQHINFPKLQKLKFLDQCPKPEYLMKFLEINGKNLKKLYMTENNVDLSLSIADFCPNLKNLFVIFNNGEIDTLKTIFINCQYLESIKIWCGYRYLNEIEVLEMVVNYSPNSFHELKIYISNPDFISPNDLESFFIKWKNRAQKKGYEEEEDGEINDYY